MAIAGTGNNDYSRFKEMNGQQRDGGNTNYETINIVKMVDKLENYRGYKKILVIRPFPNTYLGYLDDDFFAYRVDEKNLKLWMMDTKKCVDHYLDKIFFHNPGLEYATFNNKTHKPFINALNMVKDKNE